MSRRTRGRSCNEHENRDRDITTDQLSDGREPLGAGRNVLVFAALIAVIACVAGYITDPARFFRSYMVAFAFTAAIGLGAFFFVMVQYLTGSAWSVTVRRIMENIMITLPVGAILFMPVAFGLKDIYPWTDPRMVAADPVLKPRPGTSRRTSSCFAPTFISLLWSIWIFSIYRQSTKQDTERSVRQMYIASRWSAPGLFLVVVVGTLASYDWLMSIEPKWYSTIFGLYILSGGALTFMSVVTLVCLGFRRAGHSQTLDHHGALPRSRQMAVRADRVLHLHGVFAIPADLVREPAGRDHLVPRTDRREAGCRSLWRCRSSASSFRSSCCCAGRPSAA